MKYEIIDGDAGPTLVLRNQLTFADRDVFDGVIDKLLVRKRTKVMVDLAGLEYMDSGGLGMLLTLRDRAEKVGVSVALRRPNADVRELLELACFDSLFAIDYA